MVLPGVYPVVTVCVSRAGGAVVAVNASAFAEVDAGTVGAGTPGIVNPAELVADEATAAPGMAKSAFNDGGVDAGGDVFVMPLGGAGTEPPDSDGTAEPDISPGGNCDREVLGGAKLPVGGEAGSPAGCDPGNGYPIAA